MGLVNWKIEKLVEWEIRKMGDLKNSTVGVNPPKIIHFNCGIYPFFIGNLTFSHLYFF